jgi:hypothetical protein
MRILKFELRKIIQAPMFWIFAALSIIVNAFMIFSGGAGWLNEYSREIAESGQYKDYEDRVNVYADYDAAQYAQSALEREPLNPLLERLMREKYERQQTVADEFNEEDVSYYVYAAKATRHIHSLLFHTTMGAIFIQAGILGGLAMLYSLGYEQQNKTESHIYASKTGRKIMRHKYLAGLIAGIAGFVLIGGATLAMYFTAWDYSGFWQANVSSGYNYISDLVHPTRPFITWQSFSVAEYFGVSLALTFALVIVIMMFSGVVGLVFRNTLTSFIAAGMLLLGTLVSESFFSSLGLMTFAHTARLSPLYIWQQREVWLTDMGVSALFAYQEIFGTVFNVMLFGLFTLIAARRFKRKDLV